MPTYVSFSRYTQQGIEKIKESPKRLDAVKDLIRKAGGEFKAFYLVTGQYDALIIFDAPNDEASTKIMLKVGSLGNVRTETCRAFTEEEFRKLTASF